MRLKTIKEAISKSGSYSLSNPTNTVMSKEYKEFVKSKKSKFKYNTKPSDYPERLIWGGSAIKNYVGHSGNPNPTIMRAKKFKNREEAERWMEKHPNHRIVQGGGKGPAWVSRMSYDAYEINIIGDEA